MIVKLQLAAAVKALPAAARAPLAGLLLQHFFFCFVSLLSPLHLQQQTMRGCAPQPKCIAAAAIVAADPALVAAAAAELAGASKHRC